jgi:hypothetical protein
VRARFGNQSGHIAPLYSDEGHMRLHAPSNGMIMPAIRGGLMRGWLYYKHASDNAPRWVSSFHLPGGCKVQPSLHVVKPKYAARTGVCLLVAHPLEAEESAYGGFVSIVAVNGVTPSALVSQLQDEWPTLRGVTLCLDEVSPFLTRALQSAGLKVRCA